MITIVLTYRNRDLSIVKKCLDSLSVQTSKDFYVVLVDYGSDETFKEKLKKCVIDYDFIKLIRCETARQLWCKSRAINIALRQVDTPYCFVGDVDMMYHPNFVETLHHLKVNQETTYFQVGFLSKKESNKDKAFGDYEIKFQANHEATGMTLYDTEVLKSINGYDEFYHGWGSEDTDVHVRLKNAGHNVDFYKENILILHQWHPKTYRSLESKEPFHSQLEKINHEYLKFTRLAKKTKANLRFDWGVYNENDYTALKKTDISFKITNIESEVKGFINNVLLDYNGLVLNLTISEHPEFKSIKQKVKSLLGKKTISFFDIKTINNMLLETIVNNLRNNAYQIYFDQKKKTISLTIKL